jgi:hypothetical protein
MELRAAESTGIDAQTSEFSASQIRRMLQQLFPHRRLVLSQFTFFNQIGVAKATGETLRRGRRCFKLEDILSIATVIALKEEGIPLKNIDALPGLIQANALQIFERGPGCRTSGFSNHVSLTFNGTHLAGEPLTNFLSEEGSCFLFWSYDVGALAQRLREISSGNQEMRRAA